MLTLFTIPKPFRGHVGEIQRNAIESWRALRPALQIVLVGDEEGVERAARDAGVEHVGPLARNDRGTPRLDSAFELVDAVATQPLRCLVNADIVLLDDFLPSVRRVTAAFERFLVVGECRDLDAGTGLRLGDAAVRREFRERALAEGRLRGYAALDYFVFPEGEFGAVPPFLIGRACFDNWLVWRVRQAGHPVVDATRAVVAVHQSHDYAHVRGGKDEAYYGEEARYNERLAGGRDRIYTLHDATHRLYRRGRPLRYPGSVLRIRERTRSARVRAQIAIDTRRSRSAQRTQEQPTPAGPLRLLGVFPQPSSRWTPTLDTLAEDADVELTVLYGAKGSAPPSLAARHDHWFPRAVRIAWLERLVGREYPVNWAIWNSFRGLRPDCMLVCGLDTFAAQSAVLWCLVRRTRYVLVAADEHGASEAKRPRSVGAVLSAAAVRGATAVVSTADDGASCVLALARGAPVRDSVRV